MMVPVRLFSVCFAASVAFTSAHDTVALKATLATEAVQTDADDPAIWVNHSKPENSRILGTDKAPAPDGGLYVFDLSGKIVQRISGLDGPNNVDVEQGCKFGSETLDIAVFTERGKSRLRAFSIQDGNLRDISDETGLRVFVGESGDRAAPMGVSLYKRPRDGAVFAIVSRKSGPTAGYLWQYHLTLGAGGRLVATRVREFGAFSGSGEIESVAVDDEAGLIYYSDELARVCVYPADPDAKDANSLYRSIAESGFTGDREGIALYKDVEHGTLVITTDQIKGGSTYRAYATGSGKYVRVKTLTSVADDTDGIEATAHALGPRFPKGILVAMNSSARNFLIFDARQFSTHSIANHHNTTGE